uniref:Uncharacterized protein n=1 Tax=Ditylenchus dipsaci TaxID=166011 RepID=A0A915CNE2_9BILA
MCLVDRRRWSHWSSSASEKLGSAETDSKEAGSRHSIKKWHQKTNESLTSYELDELSDAFHTITSPIPLKHHHSFSSNRSCSGSPVCLNNLSQSKEGFHKSKSLDEEDS